MTRTKPSTKNAKQSAASKLLVFSGSSCEQFAEKVCDEVGVPLGKIVRTKFSNGEIYVRFDQNVRGSHAFVIQTFTDPINDNIMELLIMIDALKRASASRISAIVPHYGYARQDKKSKGREPITAKLLADILQTAGADRIVTMDLHAGQIQGFFDVPVDHLTALNFLVKKIRSLKLDNLVVVAPDVGRVKAAKEMADELGADLAILHKSRDVNVKGKSAQKDKFIADTHITHVIGDIAGKNAIIVDDMIDTAGTIAAAANALKPSLSPSGKMANPMRRASDHAPVEAKEVFVAATHALLTGPAIERLKAAPITKLFVTDTLPLTPERQLPNIEVVSVTSIFAETIKCIYNHKSVSALFKSPSKGKQGS